MTEADEHTLRRYIRHVVLEAEGWEDAAQVMFTYDVDYDDEDAPDGDDEAASGATYKHEKPAEKNLNLHQRNNYAKDNRSMASIKPTAPSHGGGPMTGRHPGASGSPPRGRSYSAGY